MSVWSKLAAAGCALAMGIALAVTGAGAVADEAPSAAAATADAAGMADAADAADVPAGSAVAAADTADAAATGTQGGCGFAQAGTGTYASSICWIDLSDVTFDWKAIDGTGACTGIRCTSDQRIVLQLPNDYSLSMDLKVTGDRVKAAAVPTWSGAAMGRTSYLGIPGKPVLYMEQARSTVDTTTVTMSDITLAYQGKPATDLGYSLVVADAETTDLQESITWTADVPLWLISSREEMDNSCGKSSDLEEGSRTWSCEPAHSQAKNGFPILSADNPHTMDITWKTNGQEGVALGVFMSTVQATGEYAANDGRYRATDTDRLRTSIQYEGQAIPDGDDTMDTTGVNTPGSVTAEYHLLNARDAKVFKVSATDLGADPDRYTVKARCTNGKGVTECGGTVRDGSGRVDKVRYFDEDGNAIPADSQGQPYSGGGTRSVSYALLAPGVGDSLQVDFIYTPILTDLTLRKQTVGFTGGDDRTFAFTLKQVDGDTVYDEHGNALEGTRNATVATTGSGTRTFTFPQEGSFAFERGKTYRFEIAEDAGTDTDVTYDARTIDATVSVDDYGNTTVTYEGGAGTAHDTFVNERRIQLAIRKEWEQADGVTLAAPASVTVTVTCTEDANGTPCAGFGTDGTQRLTLGADGQWQATADALPAGTARTFTVTEDVPEYYHATYRAAGATSRRQATVAVPAEPDAAARSPEVTVINTPNVIDLSAITVRKTIRGIDTTDQDFGFVLTPAANANLLRDGNAFTAAVTTVTDRFDADHPSRTAAFNGKVVAPRLGDVHFDVHESVPDPRPFGWAYDDDTVGVTVHWTEDAVPQVTYAYDGDDPDRATTDRAAFTNTWTAVSSLPQTGEDGATPRTWLLAGGILGALALASAAGTTIRRGKHRTR